MKQSYMVVAVRDCSHEHWPCYTELSDMRQILNQLQMQDHADNKLSKLTPNLPIN